MTKLRAARRDALTEYGPAFKERNAWAAELAGSAAPNFVKLEELSRLGHLRGHYRWANHHVHADPRGNTLNWIEHRQEMRRLAGPTNVGLTEPADLALGSLVVLTHSLLTGSHVERWSPGEVVMMEVLNCYRLKVREDMNAGEAGVWAAEAAISNSDGGV